MIFETMSHPFDPMDEMFNTRDIDIDQIQSPASAPTTYPISNLSRSLSRGHSQWGHHGMTPSADSQPTVSSLFQSSIESSTQDMARSTTPSTHDVTRSATSSAQDMTHTSTSSPPNMPRTTPRRSNSQPMDSSTRVIQLLQELQIMTGIHRDDPISVLSESRDRIHLLQAQCQLLERRLHDAQLSCIEAEQRAQISEQRALQSEDIMKAVWSFSSSIQAIQQTSHSSSPGSTSSSPSLATDSYLRHLSDQSMSMLPLCCRSVDTAMHDHGHDVSQLHFQPSSTNVAITSVIDSTGNVVQCSSTFAELFGFAYYSSRSPPGVYSLLALAPRNVDEVRRLLGQARLLPANQSINHPPNHSLTCILTVDGWKKTATVLMSLRPINANDYVAIRPHITTDDSLFWLHFEVLNTVDNEASAVTGRSSTSHSFP